uniref:Uncharacterized protein n=1 Tax=Vitis vinifera TaxID=29760 RepID=F6HIR5_VITVI
MSDPKQGVPITNTKWAKSLGQTLLYILGNQSRHIGPQMKG